MGKSIYCIVMVLYVTIFLCSCQVSDPSWAERNSQSCSTQYVDLQYQSDDGCYNYQIVDGTIKITRFTGEAETIVIPEAIGNLPVKIIAQDAFYQQTNIRDITLPQTLSSIEHSAFYRCYSLEKICIPKEVKEIGENPFFRCSSLQNIYVDAGNAAFTDIDGVLYSKDQSTLLVYPEGKINESYQIPEGVTQIADSAFGYYPGSLQILYVPETVDSMPNQMLFAYPNDHLTVYVKAGSVAEQYARDYGVKLSVQ